MLTRSLQLQPPSAARLTKPSKEIRLSRSNQFSIQSQLTLLSLSHSRPHSFFEAGAAVTLIYVALTKLQLQSQQTMMIREILISWENKQ